MVGSFVDRGAMDRGTPHDLSDYMHAWFVSGGRWSCSCGAGGTEDLIRESIEHDRAVRFRGPYAVLGVTAQETYAEMVREGIRPRLWGLGFKGSGTTFTWPTENHFVLFGLQKARQSNRGEVFFTANVTVADKGAWEAGRAEKPYWPRKPAASTNYMGGAWVERIGSLLPSPMDAWWLVAAGDDWQPVANAVIEAVASYVLPEIRKRTGT